MVQLVQTPPVVGSTIFCDDFRVEHGTGKLILIGVYQGAMVIHPGFPSRLPLLSFILSLHQRADLYNPKITFRVFLPGDPDDETSEESSIVAEMNEADPGASVKQAEELASKLGIPTTNREYIQTVATLRFTNVELKQSGSILVRADIGGYRYKLGSLPVVSAQNN